MTSLLLGDLKMFEMSNEKTTATCKSKQKIAIFKYETIIRFI